MKFINQRDYPHWLYITKTDMEEQDRESGKTTTVFNSACGMCCAVMVAERLLPNCTFDLSQAIDLSYAVKANCRVGTSYKRFAPAFAEKLGLYMENTGDIEEVLRCVRTGGAVVALVGGDHDGEIGLFTHGGHYITVISEERDGRLAILDPYLYDGKFEEEGRKGKVEMTRDVIVLCDKETLHKEASRKGNAYYLFWRQ